MRIPVRVLGNLVEDYNEVLRGYASQAGKALHSKGARGRTTVAVVYPGIVEHGA